MRAVGDLTWVLAEDWDSRCVCGRVEKAVFLVRCVLYPASRACGRYSHLGCWLAVEMVIDGRLRQGKALFKVVGNEFGSKRGRRQGKRKERGTSPHPLQSCCAALCEELHFQGACFSDLDKIFRMNIRSVQAFEALTNECHKSGKVTSVD